MCGSWRSGKGTTTLVSNPRVRSPPGAYCCKNTVPVVSKRGRRIPTTLLTPALPLSPANRPSHCLALGKLTSLLLSHCSRNLKLVAPQTRYSAGSALLLRPFKKTDVLPQKNQKKLLLFPLTGRSPRQLTLHGFVQRTVKLSFWRCPRLP